MNTCDCTPAGLGIRLPLPLPPFCDCRPLELVQDLMQPGDMIAFADGSLVSRGIRWWTLADVGHVALLKHGGSRPELIEALGHVTVTSLTRRIKHYHESPRGRVWWLPLAPALRERADIEAALRWALSCEGRGYGLFQAVFSSLNPRNWESFYRLHCSELVAGFLEQAGVIDWNCSEVTPGDLVRGRFWSNHYYQLCGPPKPLRRINTVPLERLAREV